MVAQTKSQKRMKRRKVTLSQELLLREQLQMEPIQILKNLRS
jgi:hypothetical protein